VVEKVIDGSEEKATVIRKAMTREVNPDASKHQEMDVEFGGQQPIVVRAGKAQYMAKGHSQFSSFESTQLVEEAVVQT
jgi:RNA-splicing ligase RtcB